jgi:NADPH:quinone reductase-like Zn-dependent oxidoreductase
VDAVRDCAGGQSLEDSFGAVRDRGRVVSIVSSKKQPEAPSGIEVSIFGGRPDIERLSELGALFEEGWLSVHVEEVLALEEAVEAHERIEAGHTRGKIVLSVG